MADVRVTPQKLLKGGVTPSYTGSLSTGNTYQVRNSGRTLIHLKKSGAGECIATIATPKTVDGLAVAEQTITVPASTGDKIAGPFSPNLFNNGDGDLEITFSEITGLTIAAFEL